ncbi:MAG: pyridoxal phosphate-dependent aminotransferase [Deltaproteobacteria bacterium]|jgi:aspartate aminotransferase|nr:pyridoxal phosphate-dependent aminotransferase [Deltaproteobacteria bacterium]
MQVAHRIRFVPDSPTLAITAKSKQMISEGKDVISLSIGEPDFPTPKHIIEAAKRALDKGATKYTPAAGIPELRKAVSNKISADYGIDTITPDHVIISSGAKHSLYNAMMAVINPGDEVIIPAPYWVSYPVMVTLASGIPVFVPTTLEENFILTPEKLRAAITRRTKMVILNNPSNPTGAVYRKSQIKALLNVILDYPNIMVLSDDIYRLLIYGNANFHSIASFGELARKRTIVIDGVSKAYSMTGWRIGFSVARRRVTRAMAHIQSHSTSNPAAVSQFAALKALTGTQEPINFMREKFNSRRKFMIKNLSTLESLEFSHPKGAFYVMPRVSKLLGKITPKGDLLRTDVDVSHYFLEKAYVGTVPGTPFGLPSHIRLSYALKMEKLKKAVDRIAEAILDLREPGV